MDTGEGSAAGPNEAIIPQGEILQGRYEVIKVLGLGGMGAVYQARDLRFTGTRRLCALKEMISTTPDPDLLKLAVQNFEREANLLATLSHPAIPQIYDFFTEGIRNYLVLEYVAGMDLEAVLNSTQAFLPQDRVIDWAIQICDVLSYLHNQDPPIIFRDMKPSNIMIRPPNQIVLVDFGIARIFKAEQKGTMIGTEGYSPPEQYRGVAKPQVDTYALGATLHHLLSRRDPRLHPPFTFKEVALRSLNPEVSLKAESVILKSVAYKPENRSQTADDMKQAVLRSLSSEQPDSPLGIDQAQENLVTNQFSASDSARLSVSLPDTSATASIPRVVPIWTMTCDDEIRSSPVVVDDVVYFGCYDQHLYALEAGTGKRRWTYRTEGGIPATPCVWKDRVLIGSEDRLLYTISIQSGRILWTCPTAGRIRSSARVEMEHAFFGSDDDRLYAVNAVTGREIWRFEATGPIRSTPAVGDEIVYVGSEDHHLYAVDLKTGNQRWKFRANRAVTSSPTLYGNMLVFGSSDWNVYALDSRSGYSVWRFRTQQMVLGSPRVVDGVVYVGSVDGCLYALDGTSGRQIWKYESGSPIASTPGVSESAVYLGTSQGDVISLNIKTGKERWRYSTNGPVPSSPFVWKGTVYVGSNDCNLYALPA